MSGVLEWFAIWVLLSIGFGIVLTLAALPMIIIDEWGRHPFRALGECFLAMLALSTAISLLASLATITG